MKDTQNQIKNFVKAGRERYANEWSNGDSSQFENDGHYRWMSSFIDGYKFTFEVGTGDGRGTLQLAKNGHKIVSIDENIECLNLAEDRLKNSGFNVFRLSRESISISQNKNDLYSIIYQEIKNIEKDFDVLLIESDLLNDPELIKWLELQKPFDSVVCWLIGTHYSRGNNEVIDHLQMPTPFHYRIHVQNRVYEIADSILRTQGVLHIVDRGQPLTSDEIRKDLQASHEDQASVTSLVVNAIESRKYSEPENENGVGMCVTITEHTKDKFPNFNELHLISVLSIKP